MIKFNLKSIVFPRLKCSFPNTVVLIMTSQFSKLENIHQKHISLNILKTKHDFLIERDFPLRKVTDGKLITIEEHQKEMKNCCHFNLFLSFQNKKREHKCFSDGNYYDSWLSEMDSRTRPCLIWTSFRNCEAQGQTHMRGLCLKIVINQIILQVVFLQNSNTWKLHSVASDE